jgi:hypothetical protein
VRLRQSHSDAGGGITRAVDDKWTFERNKQIPQPNMSIRSGIEIGGPALKFTFEKVNRNPICGTLSKAGHSAFHDDLGIAEQGTAKAAHRGVWQGRFDQPWDWRAANADKVETVSEQSTGFGLLGGCNIKGNISAEGERIYHMLGQKFYGATRISESEGERWFCSEAEARSVGCDVRNDNDLGGGNCCA